MTADEARAMVADYKVAVAEKAKQAAEEVAQKEAADNAAFADKWIADCAERVRDAASSGASAIHFELTSMLSLDFKVEVVSTWAKDNGYVLDIDAPKRLPSSLPSRGWFWYTSGTLSWPENVGIDVSADAAKS